MVNKVEYYLLVYTFSQLLGLRSCAVVIIHSSLVCTNSFQSVYHGKLPMHPNTRGTDCGVVVEYIQQRLYLSTERSPSLYWSAGAVVCGQAQIPLRRLLRNFPGRGIFGEDGVMEFGLYGVNRRLTGRPTSRVTDPCHPLSCHTYSRVRGRDRLAYVQLCHGTIIVCWALVEALLGMELGDPGGKPLNPFHVTNSTAPKTTPWSVGCSSRSYIFRPGCTETWDESHWILIGSQ